MKRFLLLVLLLAAPVMAQTPPAPVDARLRTIAYDAGQVFRLRVATGYQSTVILSPQERVENVGIGDSDGWQVTLNGRGDALFIKPLRQNSATNMTVITDARVYNFELSSAYAPGADTPFTVRFAYPAAALSAAEAGAQLSVGRYRLSGARSVRPVAVSDDGVRTSIEWRDQQAIPAVFAIDEDGEELLVEGHMRNGLYVIDAVHRTLLFRVDGRTARARRTSTRPPR
ncbi:TrbG/VirB9 family P-type conjugative transfer protein [Brevundimonas sp. BR2-1]|uniref:TrbG/VirB9 family P-type conjugative transfer protein n=1 Tax=Brevundimonas sp. BR2-1 TaxID=3031123 RepID=UPI0030A37FBD